LPYFIELLISLYCCKMELNIKAIMKKINLLLVLLTFLMAACHSEDDSSDLDNLVKWDGTAAVAFDTDSEPFIISTPSQLKLFSDIVNDTSVTTIAGATAYSSYKLAKSFDLDSLTWTPIGSVEQPFKGVFDGDGHTIKGLFINTDLGYQGLFGYLLEGTVKNINILDGNITAGNVMINNDYNGGIVGYNNNGTIEGCTIAGTLTNTGNGFGGIAGYMKGTKAKIVNCENKALIVSGFGCRIGGIVGYVTGGVVDHCRNTGSFNSGESYYTGGIAGQSYNSSILNCGNTANINGQFLVGGVVGYNAPQSLVINCYNTGNVEGFTFMDENSGSSMGGIVGCNVGTISNCYNAGTITSPSTVEGNYIGGVVGLNDAGIVNYCYYLKNCAKDGASMYQNGIGVLTLDSVATDTDGLTNAFTEVQGLASKGIKGLQIGTGKYNVHAALVDCLNAWQAENTTGFTAWAVSKPKYPVHIGE